MHCLVWCWYVDRSMQIHFRDQFRGLQSRRNFYFICTSLQNGIPLLWHNNGRGSVSNHQPHDCLLNRLFRRRSRKTPKLRVTGLCAGNSTGTGGFPAQMATNAENVSIWWRHHALFCVINCCCIVVKYSKLFHAALYMSCHMNYFAIMDCDINNQSTYT